MVFCKNDIEPHTMTANSPAEALEKWLRKMDKGLTKENFIVEITKVDKHNADYCVVNTNKRIKNYYKVHIDYLSFSLYILRGMPEMKITHKQRKMVKVLGTTEGKRDFLIQKITPNDKLKLHIEPKKEYKGILVIQGGKIITKLAFDKGNTGDIIIGFEQAYAKYLKAAQHSPSKDFGCLVIRVKNDYVELDLDVSDGFIKYEKPVLEPSK
jgi:hypothetical protein